MLILHQKGRSKGNAVSFNQQDIVGCVEATTAAEKLTLTFTIDPFQCSKSEKHTVLHNKAHVTSQISPDQINCQNASSTNNNQVCRHIRS